MSKKSGQRHPTAPSPAKTNTSQNSTAIPAILFGFISLFLLIAPFNRGIFYGTTKLSEVEGPVYIALLYSGFLLLFIAYLTYKNWQLKHVSDLLAWLIWLIPLSYFISTWTAASQYTAILNVYVFILYAAFFLAGLWLFRLQEIFWQRRLIDVIVGTGYAVVWFGFMIWFKHVEFVDAVLDADTRLGNIFQYPNTYAAYLMMLILCALSLSTTAQNRHLRSLHAFMLVPLMISFLLTFSRGALLLFPVIIVVILFLLPWRRQLRQLILLGTSLLAALVILQSIIAARIDTTPFTGWLMIMIASVAVCGIHWLLQKYWRPPATERSIFRWNNAILPVSLVGFGISTLLILQNSERLLQLLPYTIQLRIMSLSFTGDAGISVRSALISDSMPMIRDHPLIGVGGGGFMNIYEAYKSYPYISSQAHNYFLQTTVETGLLGLFMLLLVVVGTIWLYVRRFAKSPDLDENYERFYYLIIPFTILVHSVIDFNMVFLYIGTLVFLCLGVLAASGEQTNVPWFTWKVEKRMKPIMSIVLGILALIVIIQSVQGLQGHNRFQQLMNIATQTNSYSELSAQLERALDANPEHPEYVTQKIGMVRQMYTFRQEEPYAEAGRELIENILPQESYDKNMLREAISLYLVTNERDKAINLMQQKVEKFPWDLPSSVQVMQTHLQWADEARLSGDASKMKSYLQVVTATYAQIQEKRQVIDAMPTSLQSADTLEYAMTNEIRLLAGQAYYSLEDYSQAAEVVRLAQGVALDEPITKMMARYYLASIMRLQQSDSALYDQLIASDPQEEEMIKQLLAQ